MTFYECLYWYVHGIEVLHMNKKRVFDPQATVAETPEQNLLMGFAQNHEAMTYAAVDYGWTPEGLRRMIIIDSVERMETMARKQIFTTEQIYGPKKRKAKTKKAAHS